MKTSDFSVTIPEGIENVGGYIQMTHGQQYTVLLSNDSVRRCDAEVKIDGNFVGLWRIEPGSLIRLERPVHDTGRFTFFRVGTPEAASAGIDAGPETGLVSVRFRAERPEPASRSLFSAPRPGGNGLTGESDQEFFGVEGIEYDDDSETTIHVRLIYLESTPRPLVQRAGLIPPPVGLADGISKLETDNGPSIQSKLDQLKAEVALVKRQAIDNEAAIRNEAGPMTQERRIRLAEVFKKKRLDDKRLEEEIRTEEKRIRSGESESVVVRRAPKASTPSSGGWVLKKRHISLVCQALALAIIWNWDKDLSLGAKMGGSIVALIVLRFAFREV
jgi:hypothetical protein